MTEDERQELREKRKETYYSLTNDLYYLNQKLKSIKAGRGHTPAFKLLEVAIDSMRQQVDNDYQRYIVRLSKSADVDVVKQMQKALNRANAKNAELEKQINEAKTSSGLFIRFVRDKLGL